MPTIRWHRMPAAHGPMGLLMGGSLYAIVMAAQLKVKLISRENKRIAEARSMALSTLTGLRDYSEPFGSLPAMLPKFRDLFEAQGAALLTESEI